jgi:tetrahydromethanopterin S-methyltransferase subunit G
METVTEVGVEITKTATGELSTTAWGAVLVLGFVMLMLILGFCGFGTWRIVGWVGGRIDAWVSPIVTRLLAFLDKMEEAIQKLQATLDRLVLGQQQHGKELVQVHKRLDGIEESVEGLKDELKDKRGTA